jgi:hypothetical protein
MEDTTVFVATVEAEYARLDAHRVVGVFTTESEASRAAYMAEFESNIKNFQMKKITRWFEYAGLYDSLRETSTTVDDAFCSKWSEARRKVFTLQDEVDTMWFYGYAKKNKIARAATINQEDTWIQREISGITMPPTEDDSLRKYKRDNMREWRKEYEKREAMLRAKHAKTESEDDDTI